MCYILHHIILDVFSFGLKGACIFQFSTQNTDVPLSDGSTVSKLLVVDKVHTFLKQSTLVFYYRKCFVKTG